MVENWRLSGLKKTFHGSLGEKIRTYNYEGGGREINHIKASSELIVIKYHFELYLYQIIDCDWLSTGPFAP